MKLIVQSTEEGPPRDADAFLSAGVVSDAPATALPHRVLPINDALMCALAVARALGAEFAGAARRFGSNAVVVNFRWGRSLLEFTQDPSGGGGGIVAIAVVGSSERRREFAHAYVRAYGRRAWGYWDRDALLRATGLREEDAVATWKDALGDAFGDGTFAADGPPRRPGTRSRNALDALHALGLPPQATWDDVQAAYRKLARALHPDRNAGDPLFAEHFRRMHEAYSRLAKELQRGR